MEKVKKIFSYFSKPWNPWFLLALDSFLLWSGVYFIAQGVFILGALSIASVWFGLFVDTLSKVYGVRSKE